MKKIIAIAVVSIAVVVTAFNVYENLPQFEVKAGTTEKVEVKKSDDDADGSRAALSAYITFNLLLLALFTWRYLHWKNEQYIDDDIMGHVAKKDFYHDVLAMGGSEGGTGVAFFFFCLVNGLVVFAILCLFVYWLI